jgi:hypothetical protein
MKRANPMAEDSFEKARKAFFGTAGATPKVSTPLTECLKPQDSSAAEEPLQAPREAPTLDLR